MKWIDIDHSNPKSWPEKGKEVLFDSGEHGTGWGRLWYNSKKQNPCVMVIDSSGEESSEPFSLQERWLDESPDPTPSSTEVMREALEWYSDEGNYLGENGELATAWENIMGKKAREALSSSGQGAKGEDWISVKDGLPPKEDKFYYWLYSEKYNNYEQGEYDYDRKCFVDKYGDSLWYITHWKVPKPPGSFKK